MKKGLTILKTRDKVRVLLGKVFFIFQISALSLGILPRDNNVALSALA